MTTSSQDPDFLCICFCCLVMVSVHTVLYLSYIILIHDVVGCPLWGSSPSVLQPSFDLCYHSYTFDYGIVRSSYTIQSFCIIYTTIIHFLDIIHRHAIYLKAAFQRLDSCLHPQVKANVQNVNNCINIPSSQTFVSYHLRCQLSILLAKFDIC
jgi:hypothetical protein